MIGELAWRAGDECRGEIEDSEVILDIPISRWRQIQADVYGMPVGLLEVEEGPAYGAALLAGVGVGNWTSVEKACDATVRVSQRIEPEPRDLALMNRQYGAYRKLYLALRDIWRDAV